MPPTDAPTPLRHRLAPIGAVAASFFLYAAIRAPVPGPNEPHYLTKAKHFWNPTWCAGDFFLESADTHRVFYEAFGPLTLFLSLPTIALLGRAFAHTVLAVGWTELVDRVAPGRWTPLWSAWLFLAIAAVGNLSGEWIVGGLEAKVFGYGYSFLALAWALDRRWIASAITLGFAIAWHPLVGLWSVVAALPIVVRWWCVDRLRTDDVEPSSPGWGQMLVCLALVGVCAFPGLLPALQLFEADDTPRPEAPWTEPTDDVAFVADYLQVRYRLKHHLDPTEFPRTVWWAYGGLVVAWFVVRRWLPSRRGEREFSWFVVGTLLIALGGLVVAACTHPIGDPVSDGSVLGLKLLKFYWFRLPDVVVPMAFAIAATGWLTVASPPVRSWTAGALAVAFGATLCLPNADGPVTALTDEEQRNWYAVCAWIREHTPEDARFRTPNSAIAFKWHAARPEFVSLKDCPQDAAGIVEWNERLMYVAAWAEEHYADGRYSEAEIRDHCRAIGVDYFIAWHLAPIDMDPVFARGDFRVYDVRPEGE